MMFADEPEERQGVAGSGTALTGVSDGPTTAEPKPKVNLDDLPEFRKFKSTMDRNLAAAQLREQQLGAALQQQQQAIQATQQYAYQAEVAGKDDYEKMQVDLRYARQSEAQARQQAIAIQQEAENQRRAVEAERQKAEFITNRLTEVKKELGAEVPRSLLEEAQSPAEAEVRLAKWVREQARTTTRRTEEVDDVDVGAGASPTTSSEDRREWERAVNANDLGSAIEMAFKRTRRGR